jgi:FkbM family methyltransferase
MQKHSIHLGNYHVPQNAINGVCVDVGGNTGQFSIKHNDFFKTIHVYEPQKECYEIIKSNIANYTNVSVFDEAVFHTSNLFVNLSSHFNLDSGSVSVADDIIQVKEWTDVLVDTNCKTISLEDILQRAGGYIDYMKIDCETSEYHLLMDKDLSKIKYIGIELHWQLGKDNFERLVNYILKYFNNIHNANLNYPQGYNIEVFFESKYI